MAYTIIGGIGVVNTSHIMANKCNIQTLNNVIMFCDDVEINSSGYTAGSTLLSLSDSEMAPDTDILIPICVTTNNQTVVTSMFVNTFGDIRISTSLSPGDKVHLNGICFNVNSKYYTPAIGNIYNNGTSPLSAL